MYINVKVPYFVYHNVVFVPSWIILPIFVSVVTSIVPPAIILKHVCHAVIKTIVSLTVLGVILFLAIIVMGLQSVSNAQMDVICVHLEHSAPAVTITILYQEILVHQAQVLKLHHHQCP